MKNMGLWGENKAVEFLKAKNYTILARNYHSRFGEIDIIARKQNTIIFVEVKTRKNTAFGFPAEFVDYQKQQKIMNKVMVYMMPIVLGFFAIMYSAAFAIYYFVSNIITTVTSVTFNLIVKSADKKRLADDNVIITKS